MRAAPISAEGNGVGSIEALLWPEEKGGRGALLVEPRSVLDCRRSPSPPYSTSTLSSSLGSAGADSTGVAAVSENSAAAAEATKWAAPGEHGGGGGGKEEWAGGELPPIPGSLDVGFVGQESWDAMLGDAAAAAGQEQTFLNWIMAAPGDMEPPAPPLQHQQFLGNAAGFGFPASNPLGFSLQHHPCGFTSAGALASDLSSPGARSLTSSSGSSSKATSTFGLPPEAALQPPPVTTMPFHNGADIKPPLLGVPSPSLLLNQHQPMPATSFFMPLPSFTDHQQQPHLPPPPKRHHSMPDNLFLLHNQLQPPPQPQCLPFPPLHTTAPFQLQSSLQPPRGAMKTTAAVQQQQQLLEELAAAAKAAEVGNSIGAREILARLNQQLPPIRKPFLRSASYLKEALLLALTDGQHGSTRLTSPLDVAIKLAAYKSFSDLSPVLQFANFTATQALLDEIACTTASCIRIIDFDLGVGGQWASFLQEFAHRRRTGGVSLPMLRLTAFVSSASHHPLELHLTWENLSQFAADLDIPFEFNTINLDAFDPSQLIAPTADEVVAVSLSVGCSARTPPLQMLLQLVKQLAPKIVVAIDHGSDRGDLPFSQHFMNCFQSCVFLLDSLDAAGTDADAASKIERFLIQPRVEDAVLGRRRAEKAMAWRTAFTSAGFAPLPLSNLAEAQADCLLKRVQVRGFHVEKCGVGLALYWQRGELVSVSAWRC
ncbi:scarecrow-like protein 6 [Phragmites australis]|uniref:scarecrow-like protein 6 n=1 Tax=Phragmites australis TaxID=29695 RepID=UPI002D795360|nr:scarecrow-like protein 6 [Phragmites australis]